MAKQIPIKKPTEFSLGVILNFVGIGAIITAVILFVLYATDTTWTAERFEHMPMGVQNLSQFFFLGGLGAVCVGAYMKKQQGLLRWQVITAIISIICGLAFYLIFVLIIQTASINDIVNDMTVYFDFAAIFAVYAGCYLLVRGLIKSTNSFHARTCLKWNDVGGILFCIYLVLNFILVSYNVANGYDALLGTSSAIWTSFVYLVVGLCECFGTIITIYVLLLTKRGFLNDWTKWVKIIALVTAILTALAVQLYIVSSIYNHYADSNNALNIETVQKLTIAGDWCRAVFMFAFVPFSMFIMNWKNIAPQKVSY